MSVAGEPSITLPRVAGGSGRAIYALAMLCLINAFSYVDRSMLALVMPRLSAELHLSDSVMGLVAGLPFALCFAVCAIPAGWVADTSNRRNLLGCAIATWSIITFLTGHVANGWQLATARFALGAGEAAGHPTMTSMVAGMFSVRGRTSAFAALSASAYLGPFVGFPVVGWLLGSYGWRAAYGVVGIAGFVVALAFLATVREPARAASVTRRSFGEFAGGVRQLLATRSYCFVVFAGGFSAINQGAHLTWAPTFLDRVHHLHPAMVGFYFGSLRGMAGLIGALVTATLIGTLVRRDMRWQIRIAVANAALPFLSDALFLLGRRSWMWQTGLALSAFFTAITVALSYALYVNVAAHGQRATAAAFYFLVATVMGLILGPFSVGLLSDWFARSLGVEAITAAMLVASSAALVSALLLLLASRSWAEDFARAEATA